MPSNPLCQGQLTLSRHSSTIRGLVTPAPSTAPQSWTLLVLPGSTLKDDVMRGFFWHIPFLVLEQYSGSAIRAFHVRFLSIGRNGWPATWQLLMRLGPCLSLSVVGKRAGCCGYARAWGLP
ncbi:hypothetical protein AFLA_007620 [Aspergillus flavus NRRL3357]|nr:hypothetical protein AFLA_007620 [Aspergillus flavus NRRL3357]